jgi:hypothetical protein
VTEPSGTRIHAFDWLRGVAVLVMIQTHTQVLLRPDLITTPFGWQLVRIDGLVAPSFIFSAGFALALVLSLVGVFRFVERHSPRFVDARLAKLTARFGGWSLSAYFFHEMLLYQRHIGVFTRFFREKADWPLYWALTLALTVLTWLSCRAWDVVDAKPRARLWRKPATAST